MKGEIIKGVKGFNKDMTCRGMKYEEGQVYEMDEKPDCCNKGYHFCENPVDCFGYYDPTESVYHEVEALGDVDTEKDSEDSKICTNKIKIGARIDLQTMIKMSVDFVFSHCKKSSKKTANKSEDRSIATNSGYSSVATNSGDSSVATNSGDSSVAINNGFYSVAEVDKGNAVAINLGYCGKAKGKKGSWLVLAEVEKVCCGWNYKYLIKDVKSFKVDGKKIKEDIYYTLKNGKPIVFKEE